MQLQHNKVFQKFNQRLHDQNIQIKIVQWQYQMQFQTILLLLVPVLFFALIDRKELERGDCYMYLSQFHGYIDSKNNNTLNLVTKYIVNRTTGRHQKIPYYIFQTNERDELPWKMNYAIHSVIQKNPEYTFRYFNATQRRDFIVQHTGKIMTDAHDKLNANAYKADLFRLLIIYTYGGCYIDNPFIAIDSLVSSFDPEVTFFTSLDGYRGDYFLNAALFCAVPGHEIIRLTLQRIIKSISIERYEMDALNVTGPRKLGGGFSEYNRLVRVPDAGYYNNKTSLILQREFGRSCNMYLIKKLDGKEVLMLSRYPDYLKNMQDYTNLPHYHVYYNSRTVYNKSIIITLPENYTVPSHETFRNIGENYIIPRQFRNKE